MNAKKNEKKKDKVKVNEGYRESKSEKELDLLLTFLRFGVQRTNHSERFGKYNKANWFLYKLHRFLARKTTAVEYLMFLRWLI